MHALEINADPHPLELELRERVAGNDGLWDFLQQGSLDGVWYWDLENPEDEWISPEFWRLFGIDPATKRHDPSEWQDLIFEEDLKLAIENFQRHCADPTHPYDQVVRYHHADGSTVWVRCRGIAIRDESGTPIRMLGAHNDLTAIKRAELDAISEKEKLQLANDELKSFAYGVSHDLKSPSRTALQLIQEALICEKGQLSEDQEDLLEGACHTLGRMQTLVENLLDYGRVVDQEMVWERVPLEDIAHDAIIDLQSDIIQAGAQVSIGALPVIHGHPAQLRMLMQNLISNAVKFRRPDVLTQVTLSGGRTSADRAYLRVSDNGCGIAEEHLERIFNVFSRLHRYEIIPGNGIGLALCKRIARNHLGSIRVRSTPGEGSTFHIEFRTPS